MVFVGESERIFQGTTRQGWCLQDVRAGGLQARTSTAQTCSTLTVVCYSIE
jgi:hypothetical protein